MELCCEEGREGAVVEATLAVTKDSSDKNTKVRTSVGAVVAGNMCTVDTVATLATRGAANMRTVLGMAPRFLKRRLSSIFRSVCPNTMGVKVMSSGSLVRMVTRGLGRCGTRGVIISPIVITADNTGLVDSSTIRVLGRRLFPLTSILAPGVPRTRILIRVSIAGTRRVVRTTKGVSRACRYTMLYGNKRDVGSTGSLLCCSKGCY